MPSLSASGTMLDASAPFQTARHVMSLVCFPTIGLAFWMALTLPASFISQSASL